MSSVDKKDDGGGRTRRALRREDVQLRAGPRSAAEGIVRGARLEPRSYGEIARIWKGGCIIRAAFLGRIQEAYGKERGLANLLFAPSFVEELKTRQDAWRRTVRRAIDNGVATPTLTASLAYYDSIRRARLPANLTQAQRDFFGAHTYQRLDREGTFHTEWGS